MRLPIYQVDAFTDRLFAGNPAAVVPLEAWLDDALMQRIAAENNLSETAFIVPDGDGFELRWFTPTVEVPLCGHATLATAHVLMNVLEPGRTEVRFRSRQSGDLFVTKDGDRLALDFPAYALEETPAPDALVAAMGTAPRSTWRAREDWLFEYPDEATVASLAPDFRVLATADHGIIATAPGNEADVASRYFVPACGIDEDPVTGSAHCSITPFWVKRLDRPTIHARQISARGGDLHCTLDGERVKIAGQAVLFLEGQLHLPA